MCINAIYFSKIFRLVFGIKNKKNKYSVLNKNYLYPKIIINSGILKKESKKLINLFFKKKL
jgi:tRNA(Arg) A34 adenosine deaminase TadA